MHKWYQKCLRKTYKNMLSRGVKTCKFVGRVIEFEGFARWVRGRGNHSKTIKNATKNPRKIDGNRCNLRPQKSNENNMEKGSKKGAKIV